ncbi:hypothetical protein [Vibrio gazogenes]|uniref:Uncharacterized protein n=1 Tax=Vibrio gazogenes TaxID=687 RepID=A0A1Z2SGW2_VIBGA|nr:hypothetical protein [Vibrio gazogenes]ASA56416.1 hypothetical protein BSQ33_12405 [Vibrio gazogenes]
MKTELVFESDRTAVIEADRLLMSFLDNQQSSHHDDGRFMRFAILDKPWKTIGNPEPYRIIESEFMAGFGLIEKLEQLGFVCINKRDNYPTKGFDMIYVYPLPRPVA